jgi:hypothetical protein
MKRYELTASGFDHDCWMEECSDGDYVKYEDAKELLEALERIVGACAGHLENQLPSEFDCYNPDYVTPLSQARDAIKKAKGRPE